VAAVATLLALGAAELFVRIRYPVSDSMRVNSGRLVQTGLPAIPFVYAPSPGFTNSLGLRNAENVTLAKPENTTRVLFIGDSTTAAENVGIDELYTTLLEQELDAVLESDVEVLNLSLPGLSLRQEIALFRYAGRRLSPDLVVFAACVNDTVDRGFVGLPVAYRSRSRLFTMWEVWRLSGATDRASLDHWWDLDSKYTRRIRSSFRELAAIAGDVPVAVTAFPVLGVNEFFGERRDEFTAIQPHLAVYRRYSGDFGIPYIEMFPHLDSEALASYGRPDDPTDVIHFGVDGYKAVAENLAPAIAELLRTLGRR